MPLPLFSSSTPWLAAVLTLFSCSSVLRGGALENYVRQPDTNFTWKLVDRLQTNGSTIARLDLTSQNWHGHLWTHQVQVVRPEKVRNPGIALLFITGDRAGSSTLAMLKILSDRAGAVAAVLTRVPNQPLYEGRKEDALIAYTFDQYMKTGDETWPLLFPMTKSAVRAMDAVQAFVTREYQQKVEKFVVSGASKRGWTTWLTAAADNRVTAIAPMVIDMLNMKVQTQWADKVYGKQSEKIRDYTDYRFQERMDDPAMVKLRSWVDPYSYRERYNLPKLLLLGTNDRYWTVDALRHYWNDLPGPKLIFQTPNAGHDLGGGQEATQTLAAFFQMIADGQELPRMDWEFSGGDNAELSVKVNRPVRALRLWTADSADRDLRDDKWTSRDLKIKIGSSIGKAAIEKPATGYRAYMGEAVLTTLDGHEYKLSTEARVTPDNIKP